MSRSLELQIFPMDIEEKLPHSFTKGAYHPSAYIYAWKKQTLEKLFEELTQSNVAIKSGEVWFIDDEIILRTIPLKSGEIKIFNWKNDKEKGEDWYDFVERAAKESLSLINHWDLEKNARTDITGKIWYNFEFSKGSK